jgi:hypothetical protein
MYSRDPSSLHDGELVWIRISEEQRKAGQLDFDLAKVKKAWDPKKGGWDGNVLVTYMYRSAPGTYNTRYFWGVIRGAAKNKKKETAKPELVVRSAIVV